MTRPAPRTRAPGHVVGIPGVVLDRLLLPARLARRLLDDVHGVAAAAASVSEVVVDASRSVPAFRGSLEDAVEELRALRKEAAGIRRDVHPLPQRAKELESSFDRSNDELDRLRREVVPLIEAIAGMRPAVERLAEDVAALRQAVEPLESEVGEMREVMEPLKGATERVKRAARRLPGPSP